MDYKSQRADWQTRGWLDKRTEWTNERTCKYKAPYTTQPPHQKIGFDRLELERRAAVL